MRKFNSAIADLYDAALSLPLTDFRGVAFSSLAEFVKFDSSCWASGRRHQTIAGEIGEIHTMHVHEQPPTLPYAFGTEFLDDDEIYKHAIREPGVPVMIEDTMSIDDYRSSRLYTGLTKAHGIEYALGSIHLNPIINLWEYIVLWRADRSRPFSERDRALKRDFALHMVNAWKHNQLLTLQKHGTPRSTSSVMVRRARALVNRLGAIFVADTEFGNIIAELFPKWRGSDLPPEFAAFVASSAEEGRVAGIDCVIDRSGDLQILTLHAQPSAMPLSASEYDVAKMFCSGVSNDEIARRRGVSPATVRNQIASAYRKLEVHSKVDLSRLID